MASYRERIIRKAATLIGSLLLTGSVLATSAYAWFASSNQVSVTGMQISAKDDSGGIGFSLYYYNGNFDGADYYADPTAAPHGYLSATGFSETFANSFTPVNGHNDKQTSSAGLYPGRRLTYALKVTNSGDAKNISLRIEDFDSPHGAAYYTSEELIEDEVQQVDKPILLSYAIDIHCDYCTEDSLNDHLASYMAHEYFEDLGHSDQYVGNVAKDMFNVSTEEPGIVSLIQNVPTSSSDAVYIFFTVVFSNDSSTYYSFLRQGEVQDETRDYYEKRPDGNSNCYVSLEFQITEMAVV